MCWHNHSKDILFYSDGSCYNSSNRWIYASGRSTAIGWFVIVHLIPLATYESTAINSANNFAFA